MSVSVVVVVAADSSSVLRLFRLLPFSSYCHLVDAAVAVVFFFSVCFRFLVDAAVAVVVFLLLLFRLLTFLFCVVFQTVNQVSACDLIPCLRPPWFSKRLCAYRAR